MLLRLGKCLVHGALKLNLISLWFVVGVQWISWSVVAYSFDFSSSSSFLTSIFHLTFTIKKLQLNILLLRVEILL